MHVNLLIVDDHLSIIEGYKSILSYNTSHTIDTTAATSLEMAYRIITSQPKPIFDVVFIDLTLPEYPEKGLHAGDDLIAVVRQHLPEAKVVILTSHSESILFYRILNESDPDGILIKSDFTSEELLVAFDAIVSGEPYYSSTIIKYKKQLVPANKIFDAYNRQIIQLLSQGVKTKNIQEILHLSKSAVDKRKANIKDMLGIDKGNDEDLIREARKQGLI
ncbi:MAG: response regulator transcription factor [Flavobacterium sp.]|nr:response regulator transcription factor [Flavobacterium sp.]